MSRQRIRTGVLEGSTVPCPHCMGAGVVRSTSSVALHVLRVLEDALIKQRAIRSDVRARTAVALYILNHKRAHLRELERRFGVRSSIEADETSAGRRQSRGWSAANSPAACRAEPEPAQRPGYGTAPDDDFAVEEAPEAEAEEEEVETTAPRTNRRRKRTKRSAPRQRKRRKPRSRPAAVAGDVAGAANDRRANRGVADAPQPTDDGLALVAEIGGDFSRPPPERRRKTAGPTARAAAARVAVDVIASGRASTRPRRPEPAEGEAEARAEAEAPLITAIPRSAASRAAGGMDEAPQSIAEALETPLRPI